MNPDPKIRMLALGAAVFFVFAEAASGLTIDLASIRDSEPVSLTVSRTDTNRIELPETIINAFSSSESMDVKIIDRSALVRTGDPAELIILTEKRKLTLLLVPEDVPSRTVIMRTGDDTLSAGPGKDAGRPRVAESLPYEKAITGLVISLASGRAPAGKTGEKEQKLPGELFLARRAEAASPPFFASLYVVRNGSGEIAALGEGMFSSDPQTVAVGIEREKLLPGESARVFVVTKKEPEQ